jgi:hypothetical protein
MTALSFEGLQALSHDTAALAGDLTHLRTRTQREAHELWSKGDGMSVFHLDCTRRFGKTFDAAMKTFELMASRPGAIVRYCAPTKLMGRTFVIPAFQWVADRVPLSMRPKFDRMDTCWRWPNGGVCYLGAADTMGDLEAQVGTECDLAIGDEAGKWPHGHLTHWIKSVIMPQFMTRKWGRIFIPSTPPLTPAHDLSEVRKVAVESGLYARYTIDDLDHVDAETKARLIHEVSSLEGGHTAVQRELYCEYVTDESMAIVPEMREARQHIVEELPRPQFFDTYVAADFGFSDLTVVLFAYYDFVRAVLVIEDELVFRNTSAITIGRDVMKRRAALWARGNVPRAIVADAPLQVIADMAEGTRGYEHGACVFGTVEKTDADAALNTARRMVQERKVRIHPRCQVLIDHLANGVWNRSRTSFDRSDMFGHFDAIDAFKYLVRHVDWRRNPTPALHGLDPSTHHIPAHIAARDQIQPLVRRDRRL